MHSPMQTPRQTRALTDRQERFVYEYLIDQNASAAAQRAGYSPKTRGAQAAMLMKLPQVRERINLELSDLYASLRVTAYNLMQAQARIAFFDPRKLFDAQGEPVPLDQLDEDTAAVLLVSHSTRADGRWVQNVRQPGRQAALNALQRRYAQFVQMQMELLQAPAASRVEEEALEREEAEAALPPQHCAPPAQAIAPEPATAAPVAPPPVAYAAPSAAPTPAHGSPVPAIATPSPDFLNTLLSLTTPAAPPASQHPLPGLIRNAWAPPAAPALVSPQRTPQYRPEPGPRGKTAMAELLLAA